MDNPFNLSFDADKYKARKAQSQGYAIGETDDTRARRGAALGMMNGPAPDYSRATAGLSDLRADDAAGLGARARVASAQDYGQQRMAGLQGMGQASDWTMRQKALQTMLAQRELEQVQKEQAARRSLVEQLASGMLNTGFSAIGAAGPMAGGQQGDKLSLIGRMGGGY